MWVGCEITDNILTIRIRVHAVYGGYMTEKEIMNDFLMFSKNICRFGRQNNCSAAE
jgi:hypothetical protein